jgi:aminoglycoside 3-N-acetyltransferase
LDDSDIQVALFSLQSKAPENLIVHSSLSACGYIKGGPKTVIDVLRTWVGTSTFAMPTHTYCYPNATGDSEVYDSQRTASRVGAITDAFWRQGGVLRSQHPTHSIASEGARAKELVTDHEKCDTPCGEGSPYQKLVDWDASVLMFGVTLDAYTLFHTAENTAAVSYLYEPQICQLKLRDATGKTRDFPMRRQDMKVPRRFREMDQWLEERGLLTRKLLGNSELLFLPRAAAVHEAVTKALRDDPLFLVAPGGGL